MTMSQQLALGIDLGTTSVKITLIDIATSAVILSECQTTTADVISDIGETGYEQNVYKIYFTVTQCIQKIPEDLKTSVNIVSFTGQMHGLVLWNSGTDNFKTSDTSNLYTWQDQRATLDFLQTIPKPDSHIPLATGFGCVTYFWLLKNRLEMINYDWMGTIMDYFVYNLCGLDYPVTTGQLAASLGYFNTENETWNIEILQLQNFPTTKLPRIIKSGDTAGCMNRDWFGIEKGTLVLAGLGDVQCSFYSALSDCDNSALLNISTSLQLGCIVNDIKIDSPAIQYFPYFKNKYLALAASLNGGNVLSKFVKMLTEWAQQFGVTAQEEDVWNRLLEDCQATNLDKHLKTKPTLFGERHSPNQLGTISGLNPESMNITTLFNSFCLGIVQNSIDMMPVSILKENGISRIICSGSVLSRNMVVMKHAQSLFQDFEIVKGSGCDSATGAALCALRFYKR